MPATQEQFGKPISSAQTYPEIKKILDVAPVLFPGVDPSLIDPFNADGTVWDKDIELRTFFSKLGESEYELTLHRGASRRTLVEGKGIVYLGLSVAKYEDDLVYSAPSSSVVFDANVRIRNGRILDYLPGRAVVFGKGNHVYGADAITLAPQAVPDILTPPVPRSRQLVIV